MSAASEDAIPLSIVIAVPIWLFGGLPLLNYFSAMDQQTKIELMEKTAPILIGFLGGSVMAWLITKVHAWWTRPIISALIKSGKGCYVTTSRGNPPTHNARFLRLLIENRGRSTIHNCKGYIIGVSQIVNGASTNPQQEVLELEWSSGGAANPRSIPRGAFFYMNVASLDLVKNGPSELRFGVLWTPNHFAHLFGAAATLELQIKIAADDAAPIDRIVRFDFDPQSQNLDFQYD